MKKLTTLLLFAALGACAASEASTPAPQTLLGEPVALGRGTVRTYVVMDEDAPVEVGVALTEDALLGLPGDGTSGHGHHDSELVLELPRNSPSPYRYVLLNWRPGGHEPPGIYDLPHLDFHFYTMDNARRLAIDPSDPEYQAKAERKPAPDFVPEGYIMPEPLAFAQMGVHWVHPASPELGGETFTHTMIFGSWDGELIFVEPMVTKAVLDSKETFTAPVPLAPKYAEAGYRPTSYEVRWDPQAREHRIALTGLVHRDASTGR